MNTKILLLLLGVASFVYPESWKKLLKQYKSHVNVSTYQLLKKQLKHSENSDAPAIADPRIISIAIKECGEELVDVHMSRNSRIKVMEESEFPLSHQSPEDVDVRSRKHGYVRKGVFEAMDRMIQELDKLASSFGYEVGTLELRLFEGLRDLATQKELFDTKLEALRKQNPALTYEHAYLETSKWVSPYINNVPAHSTGGAIDIALWNNKEKKFCDMGRFNVGGPSAQTFTTVAQLTDEQKKNRLLFLMAATNAGLTNYCYEFWHYSYGDRYASYWRNDTVARYNAL